MGEHTLCALVDLAPVLRSVLTLADTALRSLE